MIATTSQPGMFPVATSNNPLTLVHTLPPPGSTTVSAQSMTTMPSTSVVGLDAIPVPPEPSGMSSLAETPNGKKVHPCSYCDKQFGSRYNASRHEKGCKLAPPGSGGNQSSTEPVLCPNCGKQFQTRDGMTRHLKKKCKLGTSSTVTPSYRWSGKKLHLCKYCGKQFSTKWNAIRHENLFHTSDEPPLSSLMVVPSYEQPMTEQQFVQRKPERFCRFCGNYFSTKYNAIRHERICTRISSSAGLQNQNVSTAETKTTADTSLTPTQITTVGIQSPASTQNVQPTPQPTLQQQIVLHQRPQQQNQPPQQQQTQALQQNQQQQLTQQLQHLQQVQQLQQQVQRQQQQQQQQIQQQQHEPPQIIVHQTPNQLQQQPIQQHQVGQQQQAQPQQVQITSQQVVFVQPYHVCKFCNKQLPTKCDPTPVLREDIQGGTINAAALQTASLQVQTPITNTVLTGVSLPMLATIPAHNITIPIQPQTPQQQRTQNQQQIVTQQQVQPQVQHQQVQLQIQPQQVTAQQIAPQQVQQQNQQVQPQQPPQMQPPQQPQQQHAPQTPQQPQAPPRASPVPSSIQQKPHGCKYCSKHFATKWYLDQHVKIHTGQAVTCDVCQKSFVTRWHLDKHVRVHLPGGKKAKRDSGQSTDETRFNRNSSNIGIQEIREGSQQNSINGGADNIVAAIPNFSMASDDRNQLQQFSLSPLAQQEQSDK